MGEIDFESLRGIIEDSTNKRVLITFHSIGDTDSVSSSVALLSLFKNATVATPDFITGNSKRLLEKLGFGGDLIKTKFDTAADIVMLVDVNNFEDCGPFMRDLEEFSGTILIIDHHMLNRIERDNVAVFNDESYNSAASIVYDLLKSEGAEIEPRTANLLAMGIVSDSAELRNAFPETFIQIGELLKRGEMDYQSLLLEMQHVASIQSRAESIRDLFKSRISIKGSMLMLYGATQNHANRIADDAMRIGADVSIFYAIKNGEVSFSARLRPTLDKLHKMHLGRIMRSLAPIIKGHGGGHQCAAGAYGSGTENAELFLESFISEIDKKFGLS